MNSASPLFAVDIGNSRVKVGLFGDWKTTPTRPLPKCDAIFTAASDQGMLPWSALEQLAAGVSPQCIIASVNPPATARFLREWTLTHWPAPTVVSHFSQVPILNQTSPPEQAGIDRLLKGVAGNALRPAGQPLILVDSGTATTVDWITASGAFAGGSILPGLSLSAQALHDHTAQLPLISAEALGELPPKTVGENTREALQSGLYWGHVGAVRELISRMSGADAGAGIAVLITGGAGQILARELNLNDHYHRDLTLQGLAITASHLSGDVSISGETH